jgi:anti-anti-sigma factor
MGTVVKVFSGEYDLSHKLSLRADFDSLCDKSTVILDMTAVSYLDSGVINEILRLHMLRIERHLSPLSIVRSSPNLKRLFAISFLNALFCIVDTLNEVLPKDGEPVDIQYARSGNDSELPPIRIVYSQSAPLAPAWSSFGARSRFKAPASARGSSKIGPLSVTIVK